MCIWDNPEFYEELETRINEVCEDAELILAGDWNLLLDANLDAQNYKHVNNPKSKERVEDMIVNLNVTDIWRDLNPEHRRYTWRRTNPTQQGRLDFFLISDTLVQYTEDANILHGYRSDHSMISLTLSFGKKVKRNTLWKLNSSLLRDREYTQIVNEEIKKVLDEYAILMYNRQTLNDIPKTEVQLTISDQLFLDVLLMKIRSKTIEYSARKKRLQSVREHELETEIRRLEEQTHISANDKDKLEDDKKELVEIRNKRIEGVLLRSRARWVGEGEKVSKYFCSLEKRHYVSKVMKKLTTDAGNELNEHEDIKTEVHNFYKNLYKIRNVEECEINDLVQNIPKLDPEQANNIEGKITLTEASLALKNMKNNKSPGSDGFTSEFFKVFWTNIGPFVVRALNDGLERGEMSVTQREGIIVCIPKGDKPREFIKNWRPISLLNVVYKIGSACISNRIKSVLPSLISEDQSGFRPNRYMGDNIRFI